MTAVHNMRRRRGFTLIEIMVVISVIALLASIVLAMLSGAPAEARDAARVETAHSVANALEVYNTANGHYPVYTGSAEMPIQNLVSTDLAPYMPPLPANFTPSGSVDYYVSNAAGTGYELLIAKEGTNGALSSGAAASGCNATDYSGYASQVNNNAYCHGVNVNAPIYGGGAPTFTITSPTQGTVLNEGTPIVLVFSVSAAIHNAQFIVTNSEGVVFATTFSSEVDPGTGFTWGPGIVPIGTPADTYTITAFGGIIHNSGDIVNVINNSFYVH